MTEVQWLWEYDSLMRKDEEDKDTIVDSIRAFKRVLINILGLNLMNDDTAIDPDAREDNFMPLAMFVGRPDIIEAIIENANKQEQISKAIADDEFENLSAAFAEDTIDDIGDMEPIFNIPDSVDVLKLQQEQDLRDSGVKIVDSMPSRKMPHISLDNSNLQEELEKRRIEKAKVDKEISEFVKEVKNTPKVKID